MSVIERAIDRLRQGQRLKTTSVAEKVGSVAGASRASGKPASQSDVIVEPRVLVDRVALRAAGYLPESNQDRVFADEYRQIKRPLVATALGASGDEAAQGDPRIIMMASALPGDGKTFTSINLALSLARERDTSVLLIDADVAKPHVSQIFGVENERGLLDVLAEDSLDVESLVLPTDVRGLSLLPAGGRRELATELLSSERLSVVAQQLLEKDPRRLMLLDTSPLLVSSESLAVASVAGQVLLVVRAGKTPRQAVLDSLTEIGEGKSVSLILNQGRRSLLGTYHQYGSYGDYGQEAR